MNLLARCAVLALLSSCKPGLKSFTVEPSCVCKGGTITMRWVTAHGSPTVTVDHPPEGWVAEALPRSGARPYRIEDNAEFVAVVPGANPANGDRERRQSVVVVASTGSATTETPDCDDRGPTRAMRGPMQPLSSCGAPVVAIHDPIVEAMTEAGEVTNLPRTICLVPPAGAIGQRTCVAPGERATVGAALGSGWAIEIPLLDAETCGPTAPALAKLQLDLDCAGLESGGPK